MNAHLGLSIIIPAYNEERRLPRTLERVRGYLRREKAAAEVIVVDDGSSDGTAELVERMRAEMPELRLVSNGQNRGKGYSVRHGMMEARGRVALFTDADLSAPIEEAGKLLEALETADVAIGSRAMDRSLIAVHQSRARELAGILFNWTVRLFTGLGFQDTQCGFKAFAMPETRVIFEQQRIEDFGFDPEILFLARRHGLRAVEVPVRWAHDAATKVHVMRDSARMFADLLRIRWNAATGRYPRK
ncbi:MAG TPA: dolichyl-phosphate beta-glucosyltransferase [Candidatus Acidoferrales bacterium]|nr:dolichyl-phosphate beta-glucosyltransferase [Candidatus Acidoferrales bacterium]